MKYGVDNIEDIARVVHEANRELQRINGEQVNFPWDEASQELRLSTIAGVESALAGATPEEQHNQWLTQRQHDGWIYGHIKDFAKRTHPCLVAYDELPPQQRVKDSLFLAIVGALKPLLEQ